MPRQGHPKALISPYDQRSVPMLTWARACFEQGSLPSLLALPGEASLMVLPGDGMFQADIALHAWHIILLPYVVEIIADHPAQIAGFHHRHIRPHSGQGIDFLHTNYPRTGHWEGTPRPVTHGGTNGLTFSVLPAVRQNKTGSSAGREESWHRWQPPFNVKPCHQRSVSTHVSCSFLPCFVPSNTVSL